MANNSVATHEKIMLACRAFVGDSVSKLAEEYETNREFVYQQRNKAQQLLHDHFDVLDSKIPTLAVDKSMLEKTVLGCMVICKGSTEDTQRFIKEVYKMHIAIGTISNIIREAAEKAKAFNQSISLNTIKVGANDEIFQAGKPVLVGVDVYSTFIYLMQASESREGDDWALALLEKSDKQGLDLKLSVNDDGTGLKKGLVEAFPNIRIQGDVFHGHRKLTLGVINLERSAYKAILNEYELKEKCLKAFDKNKDKYLEKYEKAIKDSELAIAVYDQAYILDNWVVEALQKGGISYDQRIYTLNYVIEQLGLLPKTNKYLEKGVTYLSRHKEALLLFVKSAMKGLEQLAYEQEINIETLQLMWQQVQYSPESKQYNILEGKIGNLLKDQYALIRKMFQELMAKLVRASSIVECINSLIRPYLFLKRVVGERFLDLLQCYFNTRKYRRSREVARVGKSPIELLTGKPYPDLFEIMGY